MAKLFIEDLPLKGKKVLVRVDFNVPLDNHLNIIDATRIEATLPTIRYILAQGGTPILMSHLGRPSKEKGKNLSLRPIANKLAELLKLPVMLAPDSIGERVRTCINQLKPKEILLLENLRFHPAEESPDEDPLFAKELASYGDYYVNDAFGAAHRKHSSTYTIARYFPKKAAAGYLLEKEIHYLNGLLLDPKRPFYALIGGAKISSKIGVIESLLKKVDTLCIGGGMAYTFLKAAGLEIGDSPVDPQFIAQGRSLLKNYREKIVLPIDCVISKSCEEQETARLHMLQSPMPSGYQGVDLGPQTMNLFKKVLQNGKTILWNGPLGVYETPRFAEGTLEMARYIAHLPATTVIGGGDLIAAVQKAGVADQITHISTGGGATLEYIEYGTLPGIEVLSEKV